MGLIPGVNRTDIITHADDMLYLFYGSGDFFRKLEHPDDLKKSNTLLILNFIWEEATPNNFRYLSLTTSPVMKKDDFQKVQ
ncbi:hypothetical protein Avbf_18506 [Armadillidium vulgare]|nr:hypothetical protein Avbf_18506 [Armadillidium vulgare]